MSTLKNPSLWASKFSNSMCFIESLMKNSEIQENLMYSSCVENRTIFLKHQWAQWTTAGVIWEQNCGWRAQWSQTWGLGHWRCWKHIKKECKMPFISKTGPQNCSCMRTAAWKAGQKLEVAVPRPPLPSPLCDWERHSPSLVLSDYLSGL